MASIHFFTEDLAFQLAQPHVTLDWVSAILSDHHQEIESLNFIFCSDDYLLEVNRSYLQHDYYTDIITFDNREYEDDPLESDIFISIDRVTENANDHEVAFLRELHRVIIHGVLHLIGWNDKTDEEKQKMRGLETQFLDLHCST